ncbi:similar to Saccharomyces cerevisiae YMR170C ALD2 Cytoplasmic aldehyde dehydrogenase, involved in ethanol oxidation and beta-alanine biosynthesis [Maudiozyma saulgeensis]|uniref:Similar to Saccharomyces cerevisiae YMR170C ALD2 Cytoplasmic aldehyde dehydrogenase, involved in ethanol oxidation and beta-alanine biosynthesis n=1 Tax=Maudiozyma saulgeensis TaxID=1789683 RepID=A0A1X7R0K1_9SACH|nr:similar to Saccharomyces cerevisiae YMR170C ALD2 Cytoplasmic aldehyde dehydrogenase, involved in ethanol oxidation and beta-alanine biosynthesis [Kazachstania saulgeensis]
MMFQTINISQLNKTVKVPIGIFVGGTFVPSSDGGTIDSFNPATGEKIASFYAGTEKDANAAVEIAKDVYTYTWSMRPVKERRDLLLKLAGLLERDKEILAALDSVDAGKPYNNNALADLDQIISLTNYYAGAVGKYTNGEVIPVSNDKFCYTLREPFGVVALIVPWNYPLAMACWKLQGALAAGNTVVIKPSENTSLSLLYFAQLIMEAGFPKGVVNIIPGYGNVVGETLSRHMDVNKISFTGSTTVGCKILQCAGMSNMKEVCLECGGKSPAVVFKDAQVDNAVAWTANGIFYNSGQNCTANSRIYVHENLYDEFLIKFKDYARKNYSFADFDVFNPECTLGPVISQIQYDRIMKYIENYDGKRDILFPIPSKSETKGFFIPPVVFTDVPETSALLQEEIFGPVVVITKFCHYSEVMKMANNSRYGLAAAVFTEGVRRGHRFARDIQAGTVWINSSNDEEVTVPFGGFKMSGVGRELGRYGVESYLQTKTVHMSMVPHH